MTEPVASYWNRPAKDLSPAGHLAINVLSFAIAFIVIALTAALGVLWVVPAVLLAIGVPGIAVAAKERSLRMGVGAAAFTAVGAAGLFVLSAP